MESWISLIVSFITGGAMVGTLNFIKWFIKRRDQKKNDHITLVLERITNIYHYLHILQKETRAQRCVIFRIENGGEIPVLGKDLYSSAAYETFDYTLGPLKNMWQRQKMDEDYIQILIDVARDGHKEVVTDNLSSGILKDLYESQGIVWTEMHKIQSRTGSFFYLSMSYTKEFSPDAHHRNIVRGMVNKIKDSFKYYND